MDEQLIAFVDLLGFRSTIMAFDDQKQEKILYLLTSLAEAKSESELQLIQLAAGTRERSVRPATSAFSDNIVISYSCNALTHVGTGLILFNLANNIAWIFSKAIQSGCLVRGGIAFGPLHHSRGVLFGRGLVEAYEMESKYAGRPRIIISTNAEERLGTHPYLCRDEDGFLCLDYIRAAYDLEMQAANSQPIIAPAAVAGKWIDRLRKYSTEEIAKLAEANNLSGLQNWRWFMTRFEHFAQSLNLS